MEVDLAFPTGQATPGTHRGNRATRPFGILVTSSPVWQGGAAGAIPAVTGSPGGTLVQGGPSLWTIIHRADGPGSPIPRANGQVTNSTTQVPVGGQTGGGVRRVGIECFHSPCRATMGTFGHPPGTLMYEMVFQGSCPLVRQQAGKGLSEAKRSCIGSKWSVTYRPGWPRGRSWWWSCWPSRDRPQGRSSRRGRSSSWDSSSCGWSIAGCDTWWSMSPRAFLPGHGCDRSMGWTDRSGECPRDFAFRYDPLSNLFNPRPFPVDDVAAGVALDALVGVLGGPWWLYGVAGPGARRSRRDQEGGRGPQ